MKMVYILKRWLAVVIALIALFAGCSQTDGGAGTQEETRLTSGSGSLESGTGEGSQPAAGEESQSVPAEGTVTAEITVQDYWMSWSGSRRTRNQSTTTERFSGKSSR